MSLEECLSCEISSLTRIFVGSLVVAALGLVDGTNIDRVEAIKSGTITGIAGVGYGREQVNIATGDGVILRTGWNVVDARIAIATNRAVENGSNASVTPVFVDQGPGEQPEQQSCADNYNII